MRDKDIIDSDAAATLIVDRARSAAKDIIEDAFAFIDNKHRRNGGYEAAARHWRDWALKQIEERITHSRSTAEILAIQKANLYGVSMGLEQFNALCALQVIDGDCTVLPGGWRGNVIVYCKHATRDTLVRWLDHFESAGLGIKAETEIAA